ncbi:hypothetical protein JCM8097_005200 [Rhodosporidiobolus ruineniae]
MDELRCNNLRCRKPLAIEVSLRRFDWIAGAAGGSETKSLPELMADPSSRESAVVTTCSHIFCIDCANALFSTPQVCPACETMLSDTDDVMQTALNPHDSYKTSILSGLSPAIILDIASRGLNFYTYQVQQEASFQALITKQAQERISILEAQLNAVTREANAEIALLRDRVKAGDKDLEMERRRVHELQETHKANSKAYNKLKTQFEKAKQRALTNPGDPNLQQAAFSNPASAHNAMPNPSPAPRQNFVPAAGNNTFSRSTSSASHPGAHRQQHQAPAWNAPGAFVAGVQPPSSTVRARRPMQEQQVSGTGGGSGGGRVGTGGGFLGGASSGINTMRKANLAAANGQRVGDGLPQFLGQTVGAGRGGTGRGLFRPAGYGSQNSGSAESG